jgi:hypothetical protein
MGIVRILMRAEKRQRENEDEQHVAARPAHLADHARHTRWDTDRKQYRENLRCVYSSGRTAVSSDFAQFVHRVTGSSAASHRAIECSFDGIETGWQSLFRRRCCHGFDSTAGTPILAARRAMGRTIQG